MIRGRAALVVLAALAGCDSGPGVASVDPEAGVEVASAIDLAAYRAAWVAAGVDDYRFRYDVVCFCEPASVEVTVRDGGVVRAETDGRPTDPLTVLDLYDLAASAYAEADRVTVRVVPGDAPLPVVVSIDPSVAVADEEIGYVVAAFEAL